MANLADFEKVALKDSHGWEISFRVTSDDQVAYESFSPSGESLCWPVFLTKDQARRKWRELIDMGFTRK